MGAGSLLESTQDPHLPPPAKVASFWKAGGFRVRGACLHCTGDHPLPAQETPICSTHPLTLRKAPLLCPQQRKQGYFTPDTHAHTLAVIGSCPKPCAQLLPPTLTQSSNCQGRAPLRCPSRCLALTLQEVLLTVLYLPRAPTPVCCLSSWGTWH